MPQREEADTNAPSFRDFISTLAISVHQKRCLPFLAAQVELSCALRHRSLSSEMRRGMVTTRASCQRVESEGVVRRRRLAERVRAREDNGQAKSEAAGEHKALDR
ncbi:MAG: hypothetical protein C4347_00035 [Patescibacteria group bacterium]